MHPSWMGYGTQDSDRGSSDDYDDYDSDELRNDPTVLSDNSKRDDVIRDQEDIASQPGSNKQLIPVNAEKGTRVTFMVREC